jgi:hypothetical protein
MKEVYQKNNSFNRSTCLVVLAFSVIGIFVQNCECMGKKKNKKVDITHMCGFRPELTKYAHSGENATIQQLAENITDSVYKIIPGFIADKVMARNLIQHLSNNWHFINLAESKQIQQGELQIFKNTRVGPRKTIANTVTSMLADDDQDKINIMFDAIKSSAIQINKYNGEPNTETYELLINSEVEFSCLYAQSGVVAVRELKTFIMILRHQIDTNSWVILSCYPVPF